MAAPSSAVCHRTLLLLAGALLTGCVPEDTRQLESARSELDEAKRRVAHIQKAIAIKDDEVLATTTAMESLRATLAEKEQALAQREKELQETKLALETLRKSDAIVFGEIRAQQLQGQAAAAIMRYYQFIKDYPKSPLAGVAGTLVGELSAPKTEPVGPGAKPAAAYVDPKKREREFQKTFREGYMTLKELAPFLRKRSVAQILALLGNPNQIFNAGTELGYADKAINPATGSRGMLIVGFENGTVESLRVEYSGRKITP
jgi:hypothetical protein